MNTITKSIAKMFAAAVVTLVAFGMTFSFASALTAAELTAAGFTSEQAAVILALVGGSSESSSSSSSCTVYGLPGVSGIQMAVNQLGYAPALSVDGAFGPMTKAGVMWAQAKVGTSADGAWGPMTQASYEAYIASNCADDNGGNNGGSSAGLQGGAGSITVDSLSDYSNEEVGEGEDAVPVLAFEVEADDESDIQVRSIKVELEQTNAADSEDLEDYADSVQVSYKGDVVGEADADDFSENSDVYTKSISLDDVVIEAGDTEELIVHVTALNNLDSGDIDSDAWTVDVLNVRFVDGDGVVTTEDTDGDSLEQDFDFTDFADAADVELKVSLSDDDDVNEAHVIDIDDTDDTDNVEILSAELEAEGDSDIFVQDISINFDSVGVDLEDAVTKVSLYVDGDQVGSESITKNTATPGTDETIEFDDVDFTIDAGDTVELVVKVDLKSIADGIANGDTISAQISATERALINAEDEEGDDIATGDMTGTAVGDAHGLFDEGIMVEFVSQSATAAPSGLAGVDDFGTFKIVFDVTAFDSDVYIDGSAITDEAGGATYQDIVADNIAATAVLTSEADDAANDTFEVKEGTTERFTLTGSGAGDDVFANMALESVLYALTAIDGDVVYNFNMDEFETDSTFLSGND